MSKNYLFLFICFFSLTVFLTAGFFILIKDILAGSNDAVVMTVKILVCGDGVREGWEQCDGADLGGATCASRGFSGGTLSCAPACEFNTSACTTASSGGGGGGGYIAPAPAATTVIFSGRAYPKSAVTLLKDAQIAAATIAGADANFSITVSGLSVGNYIFSLYSEDHEGRRSSLLTFPVSITAGATTNVSGVFVAPTIAVDKSEVKKGDSVAIFGQSVPQSDVIISVNSEDEFFAKTISDKDGIYLYNFDTTTLDYGTHYTKSKAVIGNQLVSGWSYLINFKVGAETAEARESAKALLKGDLNNDKRINLIDFSIAAYWYKRSLSVTFKPTEVERLNGDSKIDLVDFSIMAYYWTG